MKKCTNKMKEVAQLLGVELEEKFKVLRENDEVLGIYKLSEEKGLLLQHPIGAWIESTILNEVLTGKHEIVKVPFTPRFGEKYWSYFGKDFVVDTFIWSDNVADYARLKVGAVLRTKETALEARAKIYEHLTGKRWVD